MRKGAFELSMSFIITIVFAVVMLTLALTWLQGYFQQTNDMSDQLFKQGQTKLQQLFSEGTDNFYIWPDRYELVLAKDTKLAFAVGLKNDADDGEDHKFAVNVYATQVPARMTTANVNKWIEFDRTAKTITIGNGDPTRKISISIPKNVTKGNYFFQVAACWDMDGKEPKSSACNGDSDNIWGGSAKEFLLTVQ